MSVVRLFASRISKSSVIPFQSASLLTRSRRNLVGNIFNRFISTDIRPVESQAVSSIHVDNYHKNIKSNSEYSLPHPLWNLKQVNKLEQYHVKPKGVTDRLAYLAVMTLRHGFDTVSGYKFGLLSENMWLRRIIFLETVAGVPGMVGAMSRHLQSLRKMSKDNGWIHTLLEEAENERMHLMIALAMKKPGKFFRAGVVGTQAIFMSFYTLAYALSPRFCHRLVGYLEEQATHTYTVLLEKLDQSPESLKGFKNMPVPDVAKKYYNLSDNATFRDVILCIRADETHHRDVNHTFANIHDEHGANPFEPGH